MYRGKRIEDSRCHKLGDDNEAVYKRRENENNNLNICDIINENLLLIAAKNGNLETVKFLLSKNVNVNHMNALGDTASDIAWTYKHLDTLIELLENDAPFPRTFIEGKLNQNSILLNSKS